jgi:hypothetical protein
MPDLDITASDEHVYDVTVTDDDGVETQHCVRVPESFLDRHGIAPSQEPVLLRATMMYLLEREPASSLDAALTLEDVEHAHPDYVDAVLPTI